MGFKSWRIFKEWTSAHRFIDTTSHEHWWRRSFILILDNDDDEVAAVLCIIIVAVVDVEENIFVVAVSNDE